MTLHCGDNLQIMQGMKSESVDLIYIDPPFCTGKDWGEFNDKWTDRKSYLDFMKVRLSQMKRLLKQTGSIYLHCDPTMSHYLKLVMDSVWGEACFRNEIVWAYEKWTNSATYFQRNHDILLFYVNSENYRFNKLFGGFTARQKQLIEQGYNLGSKDGNKLVRIYDSKKAEKLIPKWKAENRFIYYIDSPKGKTLSDVWNISALNGRARERTGYPTQKPLALLERIVEVSSNENDVVLDPFCGSGTTLEAAKNLGRKWIGIDLSEKAIEIASKRVN